MGEGAIKELVSKFIEANADKFTDEEKSKLAITVDNFAYDQCYAKYAEYNRVLCQELVDWGIVIGDGASNFTNYLKFDYAQIPSWWN